MNFKNLITFSKDIPKNLDQTQFTTCEQIHGNKVAIVSEKDKGRSISQSDGLVTNSINTCLVVRTADCPPVFLFDESSEVIGIVHSGWRGTEKEIVKHAVDIMVTNFSSNLSNLRVFIGPAIDKENYLIRSDVYNLFSNKYNEFFEQRSNDQWKFDLVGVIKEQLIDSGILNKNIEISKISTYLNQSYPSYRRDHTKDNFLNGLMLI